MEHGGQQYKTDKARRQKVADVVKDYKIKDSMDIGATIEQLEKQMFEHAKNLEFEQAAGIRDTIDELKSQMLKPTI